MCVIFSYYIATIQALVTADVEGSSCRKSKKNYIHRECILKSDVK